MNRFLYFQYAVDARAALIRSAFGALGAVVLFALAIVAGAVNSPGLSIYCTVAACWCLFSAVVNHHDCRLLARRADQTRPRATDYL